MCFAVHRTMAIQASNNRPLIRRLTPPHKQLPRIVRTSQRPGFHHSSTVSRVTADAARFLTFTQQSVLARAVRRAETLETTPSQPSARPRGRRLRHPR
jgi:hypothetical protein